MHLPKHLSCKTYLMYTISSFVAICLNIVFTSKSKSPKKLFQNSKIFLVSQNQMQYLEDKLKVETNNNCWFIVIKTFFVCYCPERLRIALFLWLHKTQFTIWNEIHWRLQPRRDPNAGSNIASLTNQEQQVSGPTGVGPCYSYAAPYMSPTCQKTHYFLNLYCQ